MREGWEIKKLGEVCSVSTGQGAPQGDSNYCTNGIPFIKAGNLEDLINGFPEIEIQNVSEEVAKKHRLKLYKAGSVVFAKSGMSCMKGYVYTLQNDCYVVSHLAILTPNAINSFFLKYLLEFYRPNSLVKDSAYPSISLEDIKSFPIPVPPLSEQEKIVAELDCLSGIIEKKKQQLKELDSLAQSIFYEMFGDPVENEKGWEVAPLKESVIEMFLGPFGSALKTECYVNQEDSFCMVYEQKHAIRKTLDTETHYINKEKFESLKRFEVHAGDFIMSCRGTIGEVYRLPSNAPLGIIHPSLMKIRIKEDKYSSTFFVNLLSYIIKNECTVGNCIQMAITAKELGQRKSILPPLSLQQQFANKIELIEKQKELIKQSIKETETLFDSRMDYYFNS